MDSENLYVQEQQVYARKSLEKLNKENTKYIVTSSWFYKPYFEINQNDYSDITQNTIRYIRQMYIKLDTEYRPVKIFKPDFWTNGPELKIYQLN